jgi:LysR family hydrogen peroxide-inducible transcriptional activator
MNLKSVRYFLAVYNEKNFTKAAQECGISQPSLSGAIQRLEQQLGCRLFDRSHGTGRVMLTEVGRALRPYFVTLDKCATKIERRARRCRD